MRKNLLCLAAVALGGVASAFAAAVTHDATLTLTFGRSGTGSTIANVTFASEADWADLNGTSATMADPGIALNIRNTLSSTGTNKDALCLNRNTNDANPLSFAFTISNVCGYYKYKVTGVSFRVAAVTSGGQMQNSSTQTDNNKRLVNVSAYVGSTLFGSITEMDMTKQGDLTFEKEIPQADSYTAGYAALDGDALEIKLQVSKGSDNQGCFFALKKVVVSLACEEYDDRAHTAYADYKSEPFGNLEYVGRDIVAPEILTAADVAFDEAEGYVASVKALTKAVDAAYASLDGKYVVFYKNPFGFGKSNNTSGFISAKVDDSGNAQFAKTFDARSVWRLHRVTGEDVPLNRFKLENPFTCKWFGSAASYAARNGGAVLQDSESTAVAYDLQRATYNNSNPATGDVNGTFAGEESLKGLIGLRTTAYDHEESFIHHNGGSEDKLIYYHNKCGSGLLSFRFSSWLGAVISEEEVALLNKLATDGFVIGTGLGKYSVAEGVDLTPAENSALNPENVLGEITKYAGHSDDVALNMPDDGRYVSAGSDVMYMEAAGAGYAYPSGAAMTVAEGAAVGKYSVNAGADIDLAYATTLSVTVPAGVMTGFYVPVKVALPVGEARGDMEVYTANHNLNAGDNRTQLVVSEVENSATDTYYLDGGTGFFVYSPAGGELVLTIVADDDSEADPDAAAAFKGSYKATAHERVRENSAHYLLGAAAAAPEEGEAANAPALYADAAHDVRRATLHKIADGEEVPAYTPVFESGSLSGEGYEHPEELSLAFDGTSSTGTSGVTTGIEEIVAEKADGTVTVYDLMGRKASHPYRGVVIAGGRKVLVR